MDMKTRLLEEELEKLNGQLMGMNARRVEIELMLLELETGFKKGDIVLYEGKKLKLEHRRYDWWKGRIIKKDGTLSRMRKTIFEPEKATLMKK